MGLSPEQTPLTLSPGLDKGTDFSFCLTLQKGAVFLYTFVNFSENLHADMYLNVYSFLIFLIILFVFAFGFVFL